MIKRKKTKVVKIGDIKIGGKNPVVIQGMAKVLTEDYLSCIHQIKKMREAGCEAARVAVKNMEAAAAIKKIKSKIKIPLIADIHFDYRLALAAMDNGADKIRINPGNTTKKEALREIIRAAKANKVPLRLGFNSGSVPELHKSGDVAQSIYKYALRYVRLFEKCGFYDIVLSLKTSDVLSTVKANELISREVNYPLHLGVTATGCSESAVIKSAIGIGALLIKGIGDTIRVSLSASPVDEIKTAKRILQAAGVRRFLPEVISCPTCGRCQVNLIKIAGEVSDALEKRALKDIRLKKLTIAVMGCEVNGPGEARSADIGVACGKKFAVLFKKGKIVKRIKISEIKRELLREIK